MRANENIFKDIFRPRIKTACVFPARITAKAVCRHVFIQARPLPKADEAPLTGWKSAKETPVFQWQAGERWQFRFQRREREQQQA